MGRRNELEVIDVDPPREPIRPDQGYRVGARITAGDAGRTRLAGALAAGIVVIGLALAAIGPLLPPTPELAVAPVPSRSIASPLPDIAILHPPGTSQFVPVSAGGLRWLDPASGAMSGDAYTSPQGSTFVDAAGHGLCVCLEIPWSKDQVVVRVTLRRFSAGGEEIDRVELFELQSANRRVFGEPIQVDAAIAPDGAHLWVSHSVRVGDAWEIGIDRVDLATMTIDGSRIVDTVPLPASDEAGVMVAEDGWITHPASAVRASLRVSPDGSEVAVLESVQAKPDIDASLPGYQERRIVVDGKLGEDPPQVAVAAHDAMDSPCDSELSGWATDRHFLTVCHRPEGNGVQPFVRIENPDDITRDVAVGPPVGSPDSEWLLDGVHGVLYRWSTLAHVFTRMDVASRTMATMAIEREDVGTGDVGIWPAPTSAGAAGSPWTALTTPGIFNKPARMVGSRDGTLIYALGFRSVADALRDDRIASSGIWVFDTERADLVAHWPAAGLYSDIGYAPDWERLITVSLAGSDGDGGAAEWATAVRFHDARTGEVTELLGNVEESSGFAPAIMTPNAPGGIAGF